MEALLHELICINGVTKTIATSLSHSLLASSPEVFPLLIWFPHSKGDWTMPQNITEKIWQPNF